MSSKKAPETLLDKSKKLLDKSVIFAKNNKLNIARGAALAFYINGLRKLPLIQKGFSELKAKLIGVSPVVKNLIGDTFENEYEVQQEILGQGSFGTAYLSENKKTKEKATASELVKLI